MANITYAVYPHNQNGEVDANHPEVIWRTGIKWKGSACWADFWGDDAERYTPNYVACIASGKSDKKLNEKQVQTLVNLATWLRRWGHDVNVVASREYLRRGDGYYNEYEKQDKPVYGLEFKYGANTDGRLLFLMLCMVRYVSSEFTYGKMPENATPLELFQYIFSQNNWQTLHLPFQDNQMPLRFNKEPKRIGPEFGAIFYHYHVYVLNVAAEHWKSKNAIAAGTIRTCGMKTDNFHEWHDGIYAAAAQAYEELFQVPALANDKGVAPMPMQHPQIAIAIGENPFGDVDEEEDEDDGDNDEDYPDDEEEDDIGEDDIDEEVCFVPAPIPAKAGLRDADMLARERRIAELRNIAMQQAQMRVHYEAELARLQRKQQAAEAEIQDILNKPLEAPLNRAYEYHPYGKIDHKYKAYEPAIEMPKPLPYLRIQPDILGIVPHAYDKAAVGAAQEAYGLINEDELRKAGRLNGLEADARRARERIAEAYVKDLGLPPLQGGRDMQEALPEIFQKMREVAEERRILMEQAERIAARRNRRG